MPRRNGSTPFAPNRKRRKRIGTQIKEPNKAKRRKAKE